MDTGIIMIVVVVVHRRIAVPSSSSWPQDHLQSVAGARQDGKHLA